MSCISSYAEFRRDDTKRSGDLKGLLEWGDLEVTEPAEGDPDLFDDARDGIGITRRGDGENCIEGISLLVTP